MMVMGTDSLSYMKTMPADSRDLVLADPPYGEFPLINDSIREARRVSRGASLYFMYAEDLYDLDQRPDQVVFWTKPISTKNTSKRYSRFVEVIACYDIDYFNQNTHWATRSGVFTDSFIEKQTHPHQKPESLMAKLVSVHTKPGQSVLDPFAGSGTTERVCLQLGRKCLSIEIT